MLNLTVLLFLLSIFCNANATFFKLGEKIVTNIEQFQICGKPEDNRLNLELATRKYNRTHTGVNMNITVYEDFGEQYTLHLELRMWGDGGWKRNYFNYKKDNACTALYLLLGQTWSDITKIAHAEGCPVKPGYYFFRDFFINIAHIPYLATPGKFLWIGKVTKNNIPQTCVEGIFVLKSSL